MVPQPVMLGFVNGLAIVIGLSQLHQFQILNLDGSFTWMSGDILIQSLIFVFLTMLIIWYFQKLQRLSHLL
jgi:SulP family sulfate permease